MASSAIKLTAGGIQFSNGAGAFDDSSRFGALTCSGINALAFSGTTSATKLSISGVQTGTASDSLVTRDFVENATLTGVTSFESVIGASTTVLASATFDLDGAGSYASATIACTEVPNTVFTETSIDATSGTAVGARYLVKNESSAKYNGIYVVTSRSSTTSYTLTRAADMNDGRQVVPNKRMFVQSGGTNADTMWFLSGNLVQRALMTSTPGTMITVSGAHAVGATSITLSSALSGTMNATAAYTDFTALWRGTGIKVGNFWYSTSSSSDQNSGTTLALASGLLEALSGGQAIFVGTSLKALDATDSTGLIDAAFTGWSQFSSGGGFTTAGTGLTSSGNTINLDISDIATAITSLPSGTEVFAVHDGAQKKITFASLRNEVFAAVSSGATIAAGGALTLANTSVTNGMLAGSIANAKLANSTISGVSLGSTLGGLKLGETLVSSDATIAHGIRMSAVQTITDSGDKFFFASFPALGVIKMVRPASDISTSTSIVVSGGSLTDGTTYQIAVIKDVGADGDTLAFSGTGVWNTTGTHFNNLNATSAAHGLTGTTGDHKVFAFPSGTTIRGDGTTVMLDLSANISASRKAVGIFTGASSVVGGGFNVGDVVMGININYTLGENVLPVTVIAKLSQHTGSEAASVDVNYDTTVFEIGANSHALTIKSTSITSDMLIGNVANAKLANSTISGVSLGSTLGALTSGTNLFGGYGGVTVSANVNISPFNNVVAFFAASAQSVKFVSYVTATTGGASFTVNSGLTDGTYSVVVIDTGTSPHTLVREASGLVATAGVIADSSHGLTYTTANRLLAFVLTTGGVSLGTSVKVALDANVQNSTVITGTVTGATSIVATDIILAAGIYSLNTNYTTTATNITVASVDEATYTGSAARSWSLEAALTGMTSMTGTTTLSLATLSNGNLALAPHGTGLVTVGGTAPTISAITNLDLIVKTLDNNKNVVLQPHGTGLVTVGGTAPTISAITNLDLILQTLDNNKNVVLKPNGTGLVNIGGTTPTIYADAGASVLTIGFDLNTKCTFTGSVTDTAAFNCKVQATELEQTSDRRFKHDVERIADAGEKLDRIGGYTFLWNKSNAPSCGCIAQEVEEVLGESAVRTIVDDEVGEKKVMQYNGVIAILIEALKDERITVRDIKARLEKMEAAPCRGLIAQSAEAGTEAAAAAVSGGHESRVPRASRKCCKEGKCADADCDSDCSECSTGSDGSTSSVASGTRSKRRVARK